MNAQPPASPRRTGRRLLAAVLLAGTGAPGEAAGPVGAGEVFGHAVLPILTARCTECHGDGKQKGGLNLTTLVGVMNGGTGGEVVRPGRSSESLLVQLITDGEMPPDDHPPVPAAELRVITDWIDQSVFPEAADFKAEASAAVHARARDLWSFQPVRRPTPPEVRASDRVRSPVDRFILAKLEAGGRTFGPEATAPALVRRVHFNLLGLPPAPETIAAYIADAAPDAWSRLVGRLLASPHYGERWGRHWLDVAGFAESSSSVSDPFRPGFWRYRDWVIRAFNSDKPYDEFVREQLAGDELAPWRDAETFDAATIDRLVATGFLRSTPDPTDNQFITQEDKHYAAQQAVVEVATKALIGLTLNCVRCHDHKYDPITQDDYYRLIGLFQPAFDPGNWLAGAVSKFGPGPVRAIPLLDRDGRDRFASEFAVLKEENMELVHQKMTGLPNEFRDRHLRAHLPDLPEALAPAEVAAALARPDRERTTAEHDRLEAAARHLGLDADRLHALYPELQQRIDEREEVSKSLARRGLEVGEVLWATWDVSTNPTPTRLLTRGDFKTPAHVVEPGFILSLDDPGRPWTPPAPDPAARTTGRRLAFADWLLRPDHPLTARVMVNRLWQHHFGVGLVATVDDFGQRGARPSHPELLDWLASELVASGWSLKHIQRLILESTTYRQAAAPPGGAVASDYGAFPRRRLEAEAIRDAMLSVGGRLDPALFGPSIETVKAADGSWDVAADDPGRFRRSVYLTTRRSQLPTFLTLFDAPIMDTNWPVRSDSAIAPQALALMNHPFVLQCADDFAGRLLSTDAADRERLELAFRLAYGRAPDADEHHLFADHLARAPDPRAAWRTLAHALLASSEFIYLD